MLSTPQAATALKHQIESLFKDQAHSKKPSAIFHPPHINPFKTLPKDVPARDKGRNDGATRGNYGNQGGYNRGGYNNNNRGNFNRGGMGYQNNRNFLTAGGNMGGNLGGYGAQAPMGNFPNAMGGMNNFGGGGFNRGGMMGAGMRGGMGNRGGRGGNMGMPMGGAPMGGMNMPMSNNMMGMGAGMMGMGGGGNMGMMGGMGTSTLSFHTTRDFPPTLSLSSLHLDDR